MLVLAQLRPIFVDPGLEERKKQKTEFRIQKQEASSSSFRVADRLSDNS
jgi:hypothetical protein